VYFEKHTKDVNTLREHNAVSLTIKAHVTLCYHFALKG